MTPEQRKNFNTIFGTLFMVIGLLSWGGAAYYAFTPNEPIPAAASKKAQINVASCSAVLLELGYSSFTQENKVVAQAPMGTDARGQLEKASAAILACGMELDSFCIGEGCPSPGVSFTLKQDSKPSKAPGTNRDKGASTGEKAASSKG